LEKLERL